MVVGVLIRGSVLDTYFCLAFWLGEIHSEFPPHLVSALRHGLDCVTLLSSLTESSKLRTVRAAG